MTTQETSTVENINIIEKMCVQAMVSVGGNVEEHIIRPGDDYSMELSQIQLVCAAAHTPEVIQAYKTSIAK